MRKLTAGLVALVLTACVDVPTSAVLDGEVTTEPVEIGHPPIIQHAPYPVHLRWWICDDHDDCDRKAREVPIDSLPPSITSAMVAAAAEVAAMLAPTDRLPFVIPTGIAGNHYRWRCHLNLDNHLETGDTIPGGLSIHVVYEPSHTGGWAAAAGCGYQWDNGRWRYVWDTKPVMGVVFVRPTEIEADWWRRIVLHEIGHILGAVGSYDRWTYETTADSAAWWITDSTIVAAFDRAGGADYPGRKVPVNAPAHWPSCIAKGDVMGDAGVPGSRLTDLSIATFHPGLVAIPQGGLDDDARLLWGGCPEFRSSGDPSYREVPLANDWLTPVAAAKARSP